MIASGAPQVPLPDDALPGVYVHIPFCRYVCPYCDFNVYAKQERLIPDYIDAVAREMELRVTEAGHPVQTSTLFIGGGTPSLLPVEAIDKVVQSAATHLGLISDAEITVEVNPEGLSMEYARGLLACGINRLSIGVQTLDPAGLKVLGRLHGAQGAEDAYRAARDAGFDDVSLDFIYGWPGQTLDQWRTDIESMLRWEPDHLSLYSLIVEKGTPMARAVDRGQLHPVDDDKVADFYDLAVERLGEAGWEHYEIANWARSSGIRSRHNQIYWQNGRYFGIGAGAHGFLGDTRMSNIRLPVRYIEAVNDGQLPNTASEEISHELAMGETMMLGLRLLIDGVSASDFEARHGVRLCDIYQDQIRRFIDLGLLEWASGRLRLTDRGALVSNGVCAEFLP